MKIAIASGKGGTGKSTVALNLAYMLSNDYKISLLDCDVEEPNCYLFLKPQFTDREKICIIVPEFDNDKCKGCGKCVRLCQFNCLALVNNKIVSFPELCHGCGGCKLVCPFNAVIESQREVGFVEYAQMDNLNFIHGKLRISEAMSPPLIKQVKKFADKLNDSALQIIDCPPGTTCPVIASTEDVDYTFMVTEPTPFGLNDLKLAVAMIKELSIPFSIIINRSSAENDHIIETYAQENNIKIITKIPDSIEAARIYSKGELILKHMPEFKNHFEPLSLLIKDLIK